MQNYGLEDINNEQYFLDQNFDSATEGNRIAGILGAFLYSFIGVALWFIIYQAGYIVGATGIVMFMATVKGYEKFGKKKDFVASVTCVIITVIMAIFAELSCLAFELYKAFKNEYAISIFDAIRAVPDSLAEPEIIKAVTFDLEVAFILTLAGLLYRSLIKYNPKKAAALKLKKEAQETTPAPKSKSLWRSILSCWWVVFTLGAFFTNWIAFLYAGIWLKKMKLVLWSIFYIAPLVMICFINDNTKDVYVALFAVFALVSFIMGIVHAIKICKRYINSITQ